MAEQNASTAGSFIVRKPPVFERVEDARLHRLQRLSGACRIFGAAGFSEGLLGHLTVRDPGYPDRFWANPLGVSFNRIRVSDLVQVDHEGRLLHGRIPVNPVGVRLHAAVHAARPEVVAVCHAHSTYGSAWSAFGKPVAPITQDTSIFFEDQAIIGEPRVALDAAGAAAFAAAFGSCRTAIQTGHGLFTTGASVDEAAWRFLTLDRACHVQLLVAAAKHAGDVDVWPPELARALKATLGSADFAWLSFQTLWDDLLAKGDEFLG